jgi:hypothetical protein
LIDRGQMVHLDLLVCRTFFYGNVGKSYYHKTETESPSSLFGGGDAVAP